ncbi:hypothetical protein [Motiliproteus sp. SC1-56]|uniref:hypothetical protein n=1 Tax=Motiliproteus sp. SC1-56 TaxID=2799565 RepID=UPI001A8D163C|nr:hypothetical protein [Motiliproteus sp. SC1-56]
MHDHRKATYAVLAFGALLVLIGLFLASVRPPLVAKGDEPAVGPDALMGRWHTRTVVDGDPNTAYDGALLFGKDFYEMGNAVIGTSVRIENVRYRREGDRVMLWVQGTPEKVTTVTLLEEGGALVRLPGREALQIELRRAP